MKITQFLRWSPGLWYMFIIKPSSQAQDLQWCMSDNVLIFIFVARGVQYCTRSLKTFRAVIRPFVSSLNAARLFKEVYKHKLRSYKHSGVAGLNVLGEGAGGHMADDQSCLLKLLDQFTTVKRKNPTPLPGFAASNFVRV